MDDDDGIERLGSRRLIDFLFDNALDTRRVIFFSVVGSFVAFVGVFDDESPASNDSMFASSMGMIGRSYVLDQDGESGSVSVCWNVSKKRKRAGVGDRVERISALK